MTHCPLILKFIYCIHLMVFMMLPSLNGVFDLLSPRLCVAALGLDGFCGVREALYGVFDGDRNVEVPYLLQCTMGDVLAEELHRTQRQGDYMTNTFLTMQR